MHQAVQLYFCATADANALALFYKKKAKKGGKCLLSLGVQPTTPDLRKEGKLWKASFGRQAKHA
jgi:hypothetical protein